MPRIFHRLFGAHVPDPARTDWAYGHFASNCVHCGRHMVQLPGLPWRAGGVE